MRVRIKRQHVRLIVAKDTTARRLHYLYRDEDSAGIELLSGALSIGFSLLLLWPIAGLVAQPRPPWFWGALAIIAGVLKIVGVIYEWRGLRIAGLILGAGFWAAFAIVFGLSSPIPNWVVYAILSVAQIWSLRRVVSP